MDIKPHNVINFPKRNRGMLRPVSDKTMPALLIDAQRRQAAYVREKRSLDAMEDWEKATKALYAAATDDPTPYILAFVHSICKGAAS